jgi:outer membrane protein, multidrug efflux system
VEDRRDVLVTLLGDVAVTYIDIRGLQEQIDIARRNLVAQEHTADVTRRKKAAGFVGALDVANAEAQVASTKSQIPVLESQVRQDIYALSVLLGKEPGQLVEQLTVQTPIPTTPPQIPVGLPSELLRRRPDIRRAEAQLHAATAQIGVATADLFPKFSLNGAVGISGNKLSSLTNFNNRFWSVGPNASWDIFSGGRVQSNIKVQEALRDESFITYRRTVLTALKDVESSLVAYAKEQEHRTALADAVSANRRAVDLSTLLYAQGETDFINVLNAQRSLLAAEDAYASSTRTVSTDLVSLYKALGGGWENNAYPATRPTTQPIVK